MPKLSNSLLKPEFWFVGRLHVLHCVTRRPSFLGLSYPCLLSSWSMTLYDKSCLEGKRTQKSDGNGPGGCGRIWKRYCLLEGRWDRAVSDCGTRTEVRSHRSRSDRTQGSWSDSDGRVFRGPGMTGFVNGGKSKELRRQDLRWPVWTRQTGENGGNRRVVKW